MRSVVHIPIVNWKLDLVEKSYGNTRAQKKLREFEVGQPVKANAILPLKKPHHYIFQASMHIAHLFNN